MTWIAIDTDWGTFAACLGASGVRELRFPDDRFNASEDETNVNERRAAASHRRRLEKELRAYLAGRGRRFSVPLDLSGQTRFRQRVWQNIRDIPYGETRTYGAVARACGCGSARAVGQACGANPTPLLVPCHRVVAASGLGGFGSGLPLKRRLLALEGADVVGS